MGSSEGSATPPISVTDVDGGLDTELGDAIYAFNVEATGIDDGRLLRAEVRDEDGTLAAGLTGWTWGETGYLDIVWVREDRRRQGLGTALLDAAEAEARSRGCRQMTLTTHSFQAPDVYRARGYVEVGRVDDYPRGHANILLVKPLAPASQTSRVTRRIDALICDMDGTLFDSMGPVTSSFIETIVAGGGPRYAPEDIIAAFPKGSARPMLTELLGRPCSDDDLAGYHRRLAEASRATIPYEGIPEVLDDLAAADIRLALFTGADVPSLQMLLRGTNLLDRFEVLVGGDEVPHAKPAPDGILLACRRLEIPPSRAAYLGDSAPDMNAAHAAGTLAIAPEWGHLYHPTHPAHVHAPTPSDLLTILTT